MGDGGYGHILGTVGSATPNRYFDVYATAEKPLDANDLHYLNAKGCFTLPEHSEELLEAYFKYVHPTFPVINVSVFSQTFAESGLSGINLLLLWSMFSVSASYLKDTPRMSSKETYVSRAKLLFDVTQEHDKMVLVHSALLLSFWFADTEDVKQSWYWTSVAFGIAQSLGLHALESPHGQDVSLQRSRRITWQCCLIRDVWLAFGMGRPLRITARDSSGYSQGSDVRFADLTFKGKRLYSSSEALALQDMWQSFVHTSTILRTHVASDKTLSATATRSYSPTNVPEYSGTILITHVSRHLKLHEFATASALARARSEKPALESAVHGAIAIMKAMLDDETANFASAVTIPLVTPAMISCLETTRARDPCEDPENVRLAEAKLDTISKFLAALVENYPAASILSGVLRTARDEIDSARS